MSDHAKDYRLTPTGNPLTEEQIAEWRKELSDVQRAGTWLPAGSNVLCDMALAALRLRGADKLATEVSRLQNLINSPEIENFLEGVRIEAAHQVERWGEAHDRSKSAENWFWLTGYLAGKALRAAVGESLPRYKHLKRGTTYEVVSVGEDENNRGTSLVVYRGEDDGKIWVRPAEQFFDGRFVELPTQPPEKALHHTISAAAALFNWHKAIRRDTSGVGVGQDPDLVALDGGESHGCGR